MSSTIGFLGRAAAVVERAEQQALDRMVDLHSCLYDFVSQLSVNEVVRVSVPEFGRHPEVLEAEAQNTWVLRLSIRDKEIGDGTRSWIRKSNVWYRMLEAARHRAEVGFANPADQANTFKLASRTQMPYPSDWFTGTEVYLVSSGEGARDALLAAVDANAKFDPSAWDSDGYYVASAELPTAGA